VGSHGPSRVADYLNAVADLSPAIADYLRPTERHYRCSLLLPGWCLTLKNGFAIKAPRPEIIARDANLNRAPALAFIEAQPRA